MTRDTKQHRWWSSRRFLLATPILAVAIVGLILYASVTGGESIPLNTHFYLRIAIQAQGSSFRYIIPDKPIGIRCQGCYMATTRYLADGVYSNYPLFTSPSLCGNVTGTGDLCLIRIASKVVRSYTLQDFFDVWGVPLGPSVTLSPSYTTNSTYFWDMCTSVGGAHYIPSDEWGGHVLVTAEDILLIYSTLGC